MIITQRFIPVSNKETRSGIKMTPTYITIHETDNTGFKANAEAHARLQESGNSRQASWHLQVDDTQAIQSIPLDEVAWAAGDGPNGPGNLTSIHLEICVNSDGDFKKAVNNSAEVTKQLMKQFNISIDHVVQHNHWSGKNCPNIIRSGKAGITWDDFINLLKEHPSVYVLKEEDIMLKVGDKGNLVKLLHNGLAALGYIQQVDKDRDNFDQFTAGKVAQFQSDQLLKNQSGIVDYNTALAFIQVLAVYHKEHIKK